MVVLGVSVGVGFDPLLASVAAAVVVGSSVGKITPPPQPPSIMVEANMASNKPLVWRVFLVPTAFILEFLLEN